MYQIRTNKINNTINLRFRNKYMINTLTGKLMSLLVELQKMRNFRIVKRYITYDVIKVVFLSNKMEDRGTIQRSTCQIKYR